ncbi:hypothetical protein GCM10011575_38520 [Microlunatus endophyticus]|uniref:Uncharacterized protein n=1 Tax=Microlunatus endophyticus TaxID=1716077 RepID=A0A917SG91_9ACTN|nr:hypothetical protein GCM10011575_38520 [Microlunatus endophyticus]
MPDEVSAAMQRGLNAAGQSDALVVVTDDFVGAIRRMDPDSKDYEAERGSGVVAARTVSTRSCEPVIVINAAIALGGDRSADDVERLLAHEAGHVSLHGRCEAVSLQSFGKAHPQLVATLHGIAQVAIEELRIERQLATLGYPMAERADIESLEGQLFELSATIFDALWTPDISPRLLAEKVLSGMHGFTVTLAYLAGWEVGYGRDSFTPTQLSTFGQHHWQELVGDSWAARLALYRSIPPADAP